MAKPKCPFCLGKHDFTNSLSCPTYDIDVPEQYISQYNQVPSLWLVTVGFTKHGKTTYLAALTMMLENIDRVWYSTAQQYLDSYTYEEVKEMRRQAETGEQPLSTRKTKVARPLLIQMLNIPDAGSHNLVLYDSVGESYDTLQADDEEAYIRSLKEVKNVWFLVSLKDLEEKADKRLSDLFNIYLSRMQRLKCQVAGRNLIVVYTKADRIHHDLPEKVQSYLRNDPFQNLTNYEENIFQSEKFLLDPYVQEMQEISTELERYTQQRISGGGNFINLADHYKMGLYFTITSALGADPDKDNFLRGDAKRHRVLDPFLFALHLSQPESPQPIKLLLDASSQAQAIYNHQLADLGEQLEKLGEVTTHYLGQTRSVSVVGQAPPSTRPSKSRSRLIGPILESCEPNTMVVALAAGPIHDLDDFSKTDWRERLLLVAIGQEEYQDWPEMIILRPNDAINLIVKEVKGLLNSKRKSERKRR